MASDRKYFDWTKIKFFNKNKRESQQSLDNQLYDHQNQCYFFSKCSDSLNIKRDWPKLVKICLKSEIIICKSVTLASKTFE
jgi:hypothetical protein